MTVPRAKSNFILRVLKYILMSIEDKDNFQTRHTILIINLGIGLKNVSEKGSCTLYMTVPRAKSNFILRVLKYILMSIEDKDNFQTRHTILIINLGIGLKNVSEKGS